MRGLLTCTAYFVTSENVRAMHRQTLNSLGMTPSRGKHERRLLLLHRRHIYTIVVHGHVQSPVVTTPGPAHVLCGVGLRPEPQQALDCFCVPVLGGGHQRCVPLKLPAPQHGTQQVRTIPPNHKHAIGRGSGVPVA